MENETLLTGVSDNASNTKLHSTLSDKTDVGLPRQTDQYIFLDSVH